MKQIKKILYRADGSKDIGMGHLSRASLMLSYLSRFSDNECLLLCKDDLAASEFLKNRKVSYETFKSDLSWQNDFEAIQLYVSKNETQLIFLDILDFDQEPLYMASLKKLNIPIVVITDDSYQRIIDAELVINGNPNQLNIKYPHQERYLLGPKYFIMDARYKDIEVKDLSKNIKILISLGGSDHNNLLFKVLEACLDLRGICLKLVVSKATGYIEKLEKFLSTYPIEYELYVDVPGLSDLWADCMFAITAGGNTLFERIASRVPGATICQLERQMEIADKFEALGVNINLGFGPKLEIEGLRNRISSLIQRNEIHYRQFQKAPEVVDGRGLERIIKEMKQRKIL